MDKRVRFEDLYDLYPNKWVVTVNSEWKDGDIVTCEVFGVFGTEKESIAATKAVGLKNCGLFKMIKEEDDLGFIFIISD